MYCAGTMPSCAITSPNPVARRLRTAPCDMASRMSRNGGRSRRIFTVRRSPACMNSTLTSSPGACERTGAAIASGESIGTPSTARITSPSAMPASAAPEPGITRSTTWPTPAGAPVASSGFGRRSPTPKYARLAASEPPDMYGPSPRNPSASGAMPRPTEITASPSAGSAAASNVTGVTSLMPVSSSARSRSRSTARRLPGTESPSPSSTSMRRAPVPSSLALVSTCPSSSTTTP